MEQISLPMRIALAATLLFAALWFVALRPKPVEDVAGDAAPAAAAAAQPAGEAAPAPAPKAKADEGEKAAKPEPKTADGDVGKGTKAVLADLEKGRTVVLLIWDGKSPDDRSVRRAVAGVDRRGGKVAVHVATLKQLSGYEAITKGVPVTQSPTVLVIDRHRRATSISGLTVKREIDATVDRAMRASD